MSKKIITQPNTPQIIKRDFSLLVRDTFKGRKTHAPKHFPILTVTEKNFAEYIQLKDFSVNTSLAILFLRKYAISFRALEFLYLYWKINKPLCNQNYIFKEIRNQKPEYVKTPQDNKTAFPIHQTIKELILTKILIKEDSTKFSPYIINPEIIPPKHLELIMNSIKDTLYCEKLELPPLLNKMIEKIKKNMNMKED